MKQDLYRAFLEWLVQIPESGRMSIETLESNLDEEFSLVFEEYTEADTSIDPPSWFYEEFGQGAKTLKQLECYKNGVLNQLKVIGLHDYDREVYGFINLDLEMLQESIKSEYGNRFDEGDSMFGLGFAGPKQMFASLKTFEFDRFTVVI
jgi:hypothetical protein